MDQLPTKGDSVECEGERGTLEKLHYSGASERWVCKVRWESGLTVWLDLDQLTMARRSA